MHTAGTSFMNSHYAQGHLQHTQEYSSQHSQPPPSPPMDDYRCSLPSISNLLGLADGGSPGDASPVSRQHSPDTGLRSEESRPSSGYARSAGQSLPPTPPMSTDASFDGYNSPSTKPSSHYPSPAPRGYYYETTPPLETDGRSMASVSAPRSTPAAYPQQALSVPYPVHPQHTAGTYYPQQMAGGYYQRTLPQAFPPPMAVSAPGNGSNPWQHHHYLTPSPSNSGPAFPQSQDRYICPTCNKAFSRPSSLRIHSHSHTGEKPFKCPHTGCGKAFSVRSNMKRHERGCHSFDFNATGSVLRS